MGRIVGCAAVMGLFWACSGSDSTPSGALQGAAGEAADGGEQSQAGAGPESMGGTRASSGGAESSGGAAAPPGGEVGFGGDTAANAAGQASAGAAGAACCPLPRFEVLKLPAGATSGSAVGLSEDGVVAIGNVTLAATSSAFRWTHEAGLLPLGALSTQSGSVATALSADGQVVIGRSGTDAEAVYWPAGKASAISLLSAAWKSLTPTHVSHDGSVIAGVGTLTGGKMAPFRWTKGSGALALGSLNAQSISVVGMSADGSVIVGNSDDAAVSGFIWKSSAPATLSALTPLAGDTKTSVLALSADGSTAIGDSIGGVKSRRVRWLANGQPVLLDPLDPGTAWGCGGGPFTACTSSSRDGSVIYTQRGGIAQRWTAVHGLQALPVLSAKFNCTAFSPEEPELAWIPGNCIGPPVAVVWDDHGEVSRLDSLLATLGVTATELSNATVSDVRAVSANGDTILGDNFNTPVVWIARVLP